ASPGPIFFLCVRRTLLQGRLTGLFSGFGVATADAFYAAIATFGVAALTAAFVSGRRPLAVVGGAVLVGFGLRILFERRREAEALARTRDQHVQRPGDRGARNFGRDIGLFRIGMDTETKRSRTITWADPFAIPKATARKSGLEALREVFEGRLPPPPIAETMGIEGVHVEEGKAVFEGEPAEYLYN